MDMADSSPKAAGNAHGGGLLGKLLLPGFADSGANATFQPSVGILRPDHVRDEQESEAVTEIRDNRSIEAVKQQFRLNASRNQQQSHRYRFGTDQKETTITSTSSSSVPPETRQAPGFFPTTKPQLSPGPSSPPSLTRQQLSISSSTSVAGTSVVPQTGSTFPYARTETLHERGRTKLEKENQTRFQFWESEWSKEWSNSKDVEEKSDNETPALTLNAANLQKVVEEQDRVTNIHDSPTDSTSSSNNNISNRNNSLLNCNNDDDDMGSEALSTASEYGTVIELGNQASRLAEIEAMAALMEASPNVDGLTPRPESFPLAPSRISQRRIPTEDAQGLALPELDANINNPTGSVRSVLPRQTKGTTSNVPTPSSETEKWASPGPITSPTASEILSSALRRVGTGLNKAKASLSAPPTPKTPGYYPPTPRVEDLLKSASPRTHSNHQDSNGGGDLPASWVLRSPGSSARISLRRHSRQRNDDQESSSTRSILSPRFSSNNTYRMLQSSLSFESTLPHDSKRFASSKTMPFSVPHLSRRELTEPLKVTSAFRLAQKCFSFDSTLDEEPMETGSATSSHIVSLETSYPLYRRTEYQHTTNKIQESASWDVGGTSGAFRAQPHRSFRIGGLRATESQLEHNAQRVRVFESSGTQTPNRYSDHQNPIGQKTVLELQTPQRYVIDVEREDALDILACLVERGITAWNEEPFSVNTQNDSTESASNTREALIVTMTEDLRKSLKESAERSGDRTSEKVAALEELLKSHSYALEMKRAALSASTWLKSIGRGPPVRNNPDGAILGGNLSKQRSEVGQASGEDVKSTNQKYKEAAASFSPDAVDTKMEILTLKARLHSAESELKEKTIMNEKLDEELSKCRAEIGRLRTATKHELSITHNRSMFDNDADESNTVSTGVSQEMSPQKKDNAPNPVAKGGSDTEENKMFDESFQGNNSLFHDVSLDEQNGPHQQPDNLEILALKTALSQANDTIRLLHEKLQGENVEGEQTQAPTVDVLHHGGTSPSENNGAEKELSSSRSSDEHRTINVRMLDGENFITEWDDLTSPLPPPPDHGLRSPIVHAVLEQWTDDPGLHESLLVWMDRVMTGDDLEGSVPPLTISSLDHQVRDGFMMHVLPILLRRADIHLAVQMRAQRRTTYDLFVSVSQKRPTGIGQTSDLRSPSLLDQQAYGEGNITGFHLLGRAPHGNSGTMHNGPDQEDPHYSHFDMPQAMSEDMDDIPQSTFMGAIGGALGGLLSRGKPTTVQSPSRFHMNASPSGFVPPPSFQATLDAASSSNHLPVGSLRNNNRVAELDNQPYHRVVSAPPGRIGITFVEYRGHAMVADMAPDSPLSSWVFPSDILIAVDEVPVSGMRVRDIIQILTKRKDRQRALRVISSHAMNEFTLNQSALGDEAP